MANTLIQIKRSLVNNVPSILNVAEPAYSYSSNTLYIGAPGSNGSIEIGGYKYVIQLGAAYNHANAAFNQANTGGGADQFARNTANAAFAATNGAIAVNLTQNNSIAAAHIRANNSLDANVGGIVTGNVTVTQNLTVTGNISVSGNLFTSIPANGNTSAYATKYLVEYNPVSREFSYSSTPNASNPYITGYSSEIHVSPVAFNDSGKGTIGDPVKTIARAKELLALAFETTAVGQRKTIILHPGDYAENVTIDTQFTVLASHELVGKSTTLSGTLTLATGCTVDGLKMTNLVISATAANGTVDLIGCTVTTAVTKTSSAYTVLRGCDLSSATLSVTGAGNTILIGGNYGTLTVNNVSAGVLAKAVITMGPITLTAGTLQIADTIVYSATNSSNAITQSVGSVLTLNNSQILIPALTSVARVNLGGFYSILHSVYDKPNSTLSGTSLNAISYSQYINADNVTLSSGGSLVFPDSTIQITAAAPYAYSNAAYAQANSGFIQANAAFIHANAAYQSQNTTGQYANAAFVRANNSLDANNGGTISGNVTVVGNLTSNTITITGSNGSISGANAIFANYVFASNGTVDLFIYANNAYTTANAAFAAANASAAIDVTQNNNITVSLNTANAAFLHANAAFNQANTGGSSTDQFARNTANAAFTAANSAGVYANASFIQANAAYQSQNTTGQYANSAFIHANAAYQSQNTTGQYANAAFTVSNGAFIHANSSYIHTNAAFANSNSYITYNEAVNVTQNNSIIAAFIHANAAYLSQNTTGQYANAAFIHANSSFNFANDVSIAANTPSHVANSAAIYANGAFAAANASAAIDVTQNNSITAAFIHANAAFNQANTGGGGADQFARNTANAAFIQANTPSHVANSAAIYANGAFAAANSAGVYANAAFIHANAAFNQANTGGGGADQFARNTANAAFTRANTSEIVFVIDGGGSTISTGLRGSLEVPFNCNVVSWTILTDQNGTIVMNVFNETYSTWGSTLPRPAGAELVLDVPVSITSSASKNNYTLSPQASIAASNVLSYNVFSISTITRASVCLRVIKT